jgi:hypothetical protein
METVKKQLRTFNRDQLEEVQRYVTGLLAMGVSGAPSKKLSADVTVLEVLRDECVNLGLGAHFTAGAKRDVLNRSWQLKKYLQVGAPKAKLAQQRAILSIAIRLLHQDLAEMKVAISPSTLARNLHRIPAVLDKAYPGYARFGALASILRARYAVDGDDLSDRPDAAGAE